MFGDQEEGVGIAHFPFSTHPKEIFNPLGFKKKMKFKGVEPWIQFWHYDVHFYKSKINSELKTKSDK